MSKKFLIFDFLMSIAIVAVSFLGTSFSIAETLSPPAAVLVSQIKNGDALVNEVSAKSAIASKVASHPTLTKDLSNTTLSYDTGIFFYITILVGQLLVFFKMRFG